MGALIFVSFSGGDCALACAMHIVSTTKALAITASARFVFRPDMLLPHIFWFASLMLVFAKPEPLKTFQRPQFRCLTGSYWHRRKKLQELGAEMTA
jgi:hypothetical protein